MYNKPSMRLLTIIAAAFFLLMTGIAWSATGCLSTSPENDCFQDLILDVGGSEVIDIGKPSRQMKLVTSNDKVIDVRPLKENKIYIRGKEVGHCTLTIYDETNGKTVAKIEVDVMPLATVTDLGNLKQQIGKHFPGQDINIESSQQGIVMYGTVTGPEIVEQVLRLADGYLTSVSGGVMTTNKRVITLPGGQTVLTDKEAKTETGRSGPKIINLLKIGGPQQVLLEVKFAEVNRNSTRELEAGIGLGGLGNDFAGAISSSGGVITPLLTTIEESSLKDAMGFPFRRGTSAVLAGGSRGVLADGVPLPAVTNAPGTMFLNLTNGANVFVNIDNFTLMLRFLEEERLGRVLAEPKLVTMSGQEASFLAGGEFPFQEIDDNGNIGIQFKDFGVGLRFTPVVNSDGLITLKVAPSVTDISELVDTATGPQAIFSTRKLESMVQLRDGQTLALAGLLQDNLTEVVSKVPLLGDIPVLGALFRSTNYQQKKTDLLIAVTPHLVQPTREGQISFPGEFVKPPNRFELYLEGKLEGRRGDDDPSLFKEHGLAMPPRSSGGGMEGHFGHMEASK